LCVACRPFLPFTSDKIQALLNLEAFTDNGEFKQILATLEKGELLVAIDHQINKPKHLFQRIPNEVVTAQIEKLEAANAAIAAAKGPEYTPLKETATFDDFMKLDMRIGTILEAEKVKKADRLLKLVVDTGIDKRTVVSGIAQSFEPEEIVGKQVTILLNLAPRKIKGIESQGMILMAENAEGKLSFLQPDTKHSTDAGDGVS